MEITEIRTENRADGCVTDEARPRFSFSLASDRQGAALRRARIAVGGWQTETAEQVLVPYGGAPLRPFTTYTVQVEAEGQDGERAAGSSSFETGRLGTPWQAKWITDGAYVFREKKVSPVPMYFRRRFALRGQVRRARIYVTAMGIFELMLNGKKVGSDYFAPGFTSYKHRLQYMTYDVTGDLRGENELLAVVGGGWAVGSFVWTRKNRVYADRQALLLELRVEYADGGEEVFGTDESWEVTEDGNCRAADIYDGEVYDATVDLQKIGWRQAKEEKLRISPKILAAYGAPVRAQRQMFPVSVSRLPSGALVYDFGQNFAGVIRLRIDGKAGQTVRVRHAEVLRKDGTLMTDFLRSAKCEAVYVCRDGIQEYSPRLTYMGFRYAEVTGADEEKVKVSAFALWSDIEETGEFSCSDEDVNRLQQNIVWSARSNFMDIPTDCPQRDERMGWTGDIAVFAPTACYNFDMSRFLEKWLLDVQSEQLRSGGIPNTVPRHGYGFPATMPVMAMAFWGDACILVPWAEYRARGDKELLRKMYPTMKKYVKACRFWAGLCSFGKHRYLWNTPGVLNFGDWVAPDLPKMQQWQARGKWTATASLKNTSGLLSRIADILGEQEDAAYYAALSEKVADAYRSILTDGNGKLKEEFQTAYVLPLQFGIFRGEERKNAAENLRRLVEKNGYCVGTGFPGTPYILFALADNGQADAAYKMLLNKKCPSWLYEVKAGATTVWERWDGLNEEGECPIGDDGTAGVMISYNHYASGAVGDFLYRRVLGVEPIEAGYRKFRVCPVLGGGMSEAKGSVKTPYGKIEVHWEKQGGVFSVSVRVPVGTACELTLPDGGTETLPSGVYERQCAAGEESRAGA